MQLYEFMGRVQSAAKLPTLDQAMNATRATFATLADRLGTDKARHLGSQLPAEIGRFLDAADPAGESFSPDEFLKRVSEREGVALALSVCHTRAVLEVLRLAASAGLIGGVLDQLPADYVHLFAGTTSKMPGGT